MDSNSSWATYYFPSFSFPHQHRRCSEVNEHIYPCIIYEKDHHECMDEKVAHYHCILRSLFLPVLPCLRPVGRLERLPLVDIHLVDQIPAFPLDKR